MTEHSGDSYEGIAGKYASTVDAKPHNVLCERTATISLLPRLAGAVEFKSAITQLLEGHELAVHYRDHPLVGQSKGTCECHSAPDWLLIDEMTDTEVILICTGTHTDLFAWNIVVSKASTPGRMKMWGSASSFISSEVHDC